jgi:alpha-glucosidase
MSLVAAVLLALAPAAAAPRLERHELRSPDGLTAVTVELGEDVRLSVARRGRAVLLPSTIGLEIEGGPALGRAPRSRRVRRSSADLRLPVPVPVRRRTVVDRHHELVIELRDGLSLAVRAWDDAVAYRLATALEGEIRVRGEEATFRFPEGSVGWLPIADCSRRKGQDCFHTSFEEVYTCCRSASSDPSAAPSCRRSSRCRAGRRWC